MQNRGLDVVWIYQTIVVFLLTIEENRENLQKCYKQIQISFFISPKFTVIGHHPTNTMEKITPVTLSLPAVALRPP